MLSVCKQNGTPLFLILLCSTLLLITSTTNAIDTALTLPWQLQSLTSRNGKVDTTLICRIDFLHGTVYVEIQCDGRTGKMNPMSTWTGTFKSLGHSKIELSQLTVGKHECSLGPLAGELIRQWTQIRSYTVTKDGYGLTLMLPGDGSGWFFSVALPPGM
jgi:hypothetical protein